MLRKLGSAIVGTLLPLISKAATTAGAAFDTKDYDGNFIVNMFSVTTNGADVTLNGKLQESDDGSTGWTDIAGAAFTEVDDTAGGAFESIVIEVDTTKRYIRFVGAVAGTSPSFAFGASYTGYKRA